MAWIVQSRLTDPGRVVNEDGCGAVGAYAWILDGAGLSPTPRFAGTGTDAAWLVAETSRYLARGEASDIGAALDGLQSHLASAFGPAVVDDPAGGPTSCLGLIRLRGDASGQLVLDSAILGDVVILASRPDGSIAVLTDERVKPFEALTFAAMAGLPRSGSELPAVARAQIKKNREAVNRPDGFAVICPARPWAHLALTASTVIDASKPVVLMSDGFSRLFDVFGLMSAAEVYRACCACNTDALLRTLRSAERADPDAARYTRFKIHDDATVLVVRAD